jgi:hypothetical protein
MDEPTLAASAVGLLAALFQKAAESAAGEAGKRAVGELVGWFKAKLNKPREQEAIEELAKAPHEAAHGKILEALLDLRLKDKPDLATELAELVRKVEAAGVTIQSAVVDGDDAQVVQVKGDHNVVKLSRGD